MTQALFGGKYSVERELARGGSSVVYLASHLLTGRRVALKVIEATVSGRTPNASVRFLREARAFSMVNHPGIVEVFDAGEEADGTLYLAQELLEGRTLADATRDGLLRVSEVVRIGLQVLSALEAVHAGGLVHRDLKPANIFLLQRPEGWAIKIIDFGLVKSILDGAAPVTGVGVMVGAPEYMSPEQARGESTVDVRCDIWGVGATLFYALSSRPPFAESNLFALLFRIATDKAPSLGTLRPELPASLAAVIDRALEQDPNRRWSTATEMRAALELAAEAFGLNREANELKASAPTVIETAPKKDEPTPKTNVPEVVDAPERTQDPDEETVPEDERKTPGPPREIQLTPTVIPKIDAEPLSIHDDLTVPLAKPIDPVAITPRIASQIAPPPLPTGPPPLPTREMRVFRPLPEQAPAPSQLSLANRRLITALALGLFALVSLIALFALR